MQIVSAISIHRRNAVWKRLGIYCELFNYELINYELRMMNDE